MTSLAAGIICGCLLSCAVSLIILSWRLAEIHQALLRLHAHEDVSKP